MEQESFDALNGRVSAISMTLSAVLTSLTPLNAAEAAVRLAMQLEESKQQDSVEGVTEAETRARDAVAESYLQLLSALSERPL